MLTGENTHENVRTAFHSTPVEAVQEFGGKHNVEEIRARETRKRNLEVIVLNILIY